MSTIGRNRLGVCSEGEEGSGKGGDKDSGRNRKGVENREKEGRGRVSGVRMRRH